MPVNVSCPDCLRQLKVPEDVLGQSVRCPLCQAVFTAKDAGGAKAPPPVESENDVAPLSMIDDDPPREERRGPRGRGREDRPRRPARERDDRDDREEREDRRPARRPSATRGFELFVHRDPNDKLKGEFNAEIDADGLNIWRGRGREILVELGSKVEYLGDARLLLDLEGRKVEVTPVHREGLHDELAREVMAVLGNRDEPFRMPVKPRGKVVWLSLLPLSIPMLAWLLGDGVAGFAGVLTFSILGAVLAGLALIFVMQRAMATSTRAWTAIGLALGGFFILGIALRVDHSGPPEPPTAFTHWIPFAPLDSGFRADFPGLPETEMPKGMPIHAQLTKVFTLEMGGRTHLIAGFGDTPNGVAALSELSPGRVIMNNSRILSQRKVDVDNTSGVEVRFETNEGRSGIARYYYKDGRLFGITFVSNKLSPTSKDAQKFIDSFAFDTSTGWPGPPTPGIKPIQTTNQNPPIGRNPLIGPDPPVDQNVPGTNLGQGGTLILAHTSPFVWAGYVGNSNRIIAIAVDGMVHFGDERGHRTKFLTLKLNEEVSGAALSVDSRTLAVLGINGKLVLIDTLTSRQTNLKPDTIGQTALWNAAFSPDGKFLATAHGDSKVRIWDLGKSVVTKRFSVSTNQVLSVVFSQDGKELVCGAADRTIYHLDATDGRIITKLVGHSEPNAPWDGVRSFEWKLRALAMAADGTIFSGSNDFTARFWKLPFPQAKETFKHPSEVTATAFHPAGRLALSAEAKGWVRLFDATTYKERAVVRSRPAGPRYDSWIRSVAFNATSNKILVADGSRLECWDLSTRTPFQAGDLVPVKPRASSGPSELQERGRLLEHQVALVCPEKKCALLFTADLKVHRYTYPEWKLTKSSPFPVAVHSAALDAKTGTLYAIEGGGRPIARLGAKILTFDIADLLDNKALPAKLEPMKRLEVGQNPRDLFLDASRKSLYFAEGNFNKLLVRKFDTETLDVPKTILDKDWWNVQLVGSPDRKSLYVLGSELGNQNPVVVRFQADTGKKEKELAIAQNLSAFLHAGDNRVLLRGTGGHAILDWKTSQVTVLSPFRNEPGAWVAPKGTRVYIEAVFSRVLNAYDVPAGARTLPAPAFTLEFKDPVRNFNQRGPTFTPDGKFLLYSWGQLIGLGKDAKPSEPKVEP